jgi:hypothetical protein
MGVPHLRTRRRYGFAAAMFSRSVLVQCPSRLRADDRTDLLYQVDSLSFHLVQISPVTSDRVDVSVDGGLGVVAAP